jgi:hypothetical protein
MTPKSNFPSWMAESVAGWEISGSAPNPIAALRAEHGLRDRLIANGRDPDTGRYVARPIDPDRLARAQGKAFSSEALPIPSELDALSSEALCAAIDLVEEAWIRGELHRRGVSETDARERWRIASKWKNRRSEDEVRRPMFDGPHQWSIWDAPHDAPLGWYLDHYVEIASRVLGGARDVPGCDSGASRIGSDAHLGVVAVDEWLNRQPDNTRVLALMIATGDSSNQIADSMGMALSTARRHIQKLLDACDRGAIYHLDKRRRNRTGPRP